MKKLLNTLYVLTPESYLFCRNENICVRIEDAEKLCVPALNIDSIVCFGKMTVSTPLLEFCGSHGISLTFLRENGHFMGRLQGPVNGNVLLRKRQYRIDSVCTVNAVRPRSPWRFGSVSALCLEVSAYDACGRV